MRVFNNTARYVDQGGGKRKGSFAMFLEPHHPDILEFLEMKLNHGADEVRARDLFYGVWASDLFMARVRDDQAWSLFCPSKCPDLCDLWGKAYASRYTHYEAAGVAERTVPARTVWSKMLTSMIETGTPYLCFKDAVNRKSNQQNVGVIKSSNLCVEIMQVSTPEETAVCNLASVALPAFLRDDGEYDYDGLEQTVRMLVRNIDKIIDRTHYPIPTAKRSNQRHRPMAIGVQGLADVFQRRGEPFDSETARALNRRIFATMYWAAVSESCALAASHGPYASYAGSPASQGRLQYDLWGVEPHPALDWDGLKADVAKHGLRNSLLIGLMPTASSASILMNHECFEPLVSNLFTRRTLTGEYVKLNPHLVKALEQRGLWTRPMRDELIRHRGSVAELSDVPSELKAVFRTAYEIPMRSVIDMSVDRGCYVCQSSSKNLFFPLAKPNVVTAALMHAWKSGEKTGSYYIRIKPATTSLAQTIDPVAPRPAEEEPEPEPEPEPDPSTPPDPQDPEEEGGC